MYALVNLFLKQHKLRLPLGYNRHTCYTHHIGMEWDFGALENRKKNRNKMHLNILYYNIRNIIIYNY